MFTTDTTSDNAAALTRLLEGIKKNSQTELEKGRRFETLIRDWLRKEPVYRDLFRDVQSWKDWAETHRELAPNAKDIGVDLVGTNAGDSGFTAIQCKFYAPDRRVSKADIDSFLAASSKPFFTRRFLVATNNEWSDNVTTELERQSPQVILIKRSELAGSMIDWAEYLRTGRVHSRSKRTPRPYQQEAISKVLEGFRTADRGKLIMACGTGKTYTAMKIAEAMEGSGGLVMFLVPSLSLLSQTLSDWKQQCAFPIHAFAVCSDTTTGRADAEDVASITTGSELAYPATTSAEKLAREVARARKDAGAMTVIFSTYQSIDVVSEAQKLHGLEKIGLVICDEAHRTAGGHSKEDPDAPFQRIHQNTFIEAGKRLYMTATPKIYAGEAKQQSEAGEIVLYSMDDEEVFGRTFHSISFTEAVRLGSLVDYKVIVLAVDESLIERQGFDDYEILREGGLPVSHAAKVVGCWRALSKLDLKKDSSIQDDLRCMRRAVGFAQVIDPPPRIVIH